MCRYAFSTYKLHFACFKCRKVFKQPAPLDLLKRDDKLVRYEQLRSKQTLSNDKQMGFNEINRDYYGVQNTHQQSAEKNGKLKYWSEKVKVLENEFSKLK